MAGEETPTLPDDAVLIMLDTIRAEIIEEVKSLGQVVSQPLHTDLAWMLKDLGAAAQTWATTLPQLEAALHGVNRRLDTPPDLGLRAAMEDVLHRLEDLYPAKRLRWYTRLPWQVWLGGLVLVGTLGVWGGWQTTRGNAQERLYAGLMGQVDRLLVESYTTLPAPVQAGLNGLYKPLGLQTPGERKGGKR